MQLYDPTNFRGICQKIDFLCDSSDASYPRLKKTAQINDDYERIIGWLINADGTAQFDDTNYSNLPIGTYDLSDGVNSYAFNDKFLQIINIQIKDLNGKWNILRPIDQSELESNIPLNELYPESGIPTKYDKVSDDTIKLYPTPAIGKVTLTGGLKIYFKRTASLFTPASDISEDTQEPGFASPYHEILAYMASMPYCMKYKKDRVALYEKRIDDIKKELINHYSSKNKDQRQEATMSPIMFR